MAGVVPVEGLAFNDGLVCRGINNFIGGWLIPRAGNICSGPYLFRAIPDDFVLMSSDFVGGKHHRFNGNVYVFALSYFSSRCSITSRLGTRDDMNHRLDLATLHCNQPFFGVACIVRGNGIRIFKSVS